LKPGRDKFTCPFAGMIKALNLAEKRKRIAITVIATSRVRVNNSLPVLTLSVKLIVVSLFHPGASTAIISLSNNGTRGTHHRYFQRVSDYLRPQGVDASVRWPSPWEDTAVMLTLRFRTRAPAWIDSTIAAASSSGVVRGTSAWVDFVSE